LPDLTAFARLSNQIRRRTANSSALAGQIAPKLLPRKDAMHFCSQPFFLFFTALFIVYWSLRWHQLRVWLLTGASFYFYAKWNEMLALLICISTALDYLIALGMDRSTSGWRRKLLLTISLAANLGLLCYFKYANFFLASMEQGLHAVGADASFPVLSVVLPIGISFYTFEAINYTMDVYRRRIPAERNLGNFMLFITFFPHLIAGPIVRARDFLPQIRRRKRWDWARMQLGVQYFLMGLFKKLAIADRMALLSGPVFEYPEKYSSGALWLATLAFALRIYCDFSGYTDMALGTAHLLGYKLALNFNMPYLAANVSEFWRRWHISLSTWLRDYLFIPCGGSRGSNWQICRNLLITMTLGGLWHGISWMFVVWGLLHGVYLVVHRAFKAFCNTRPRLDGALQTIPGTALRMALTFACVCLGWIFFVTGSLEAEARLKADKANAKMGVRTATVGYSAYRASSVVLRNMVRPHAGLHAPLHPRTLWYTVIVMAICHVLGQRGVWKKIAVRIPAPVIGFGYAVVLTVALVLAPDSGKAFIYFQF
jgi:alginate O-acetyltransferase complex protein AlgI